MSCAFDSAFDSPTGNGAFCVGVTVAAVVKSVMRSPRTGMMRSILFWLFR